MRCVLGPVRTADPHDDDLVAFAEATRSVIVSGDKHLLSMTDQPPVYGPAAFPDLLTTHDPP